MVHFGSQFERAVHPGSQGRGQTYESVNRVTSIDKKQRGLSACPQPTFFFILPGMVLPTFRWIFLLSSNLSERVFIDTPRGVSMVIPDPTKLATKADHQSCLLMFWTSSLQEWKNKCLLR